MAELVLGGRLGDTFTGGRLENLSILFQAIDDQKYGRTPLFGMTCKF